MDNASKALIMAGAILISIAIVGVGVYIFSSTSSITDVGATQMNATQISLANQTLRQYEGTRIRGSEVKQLIDYVVVLNKGGSYPKTIALSGKTKAEDVNSARYYTVKCTTDTNTGYISKITINNESK